MTTVSPWSVYAKEAAQNGGGNTGKTSHAVSGGGFAPGDTSTTSAGEGGLRLRAGG